MINSIHKFQKKKKNLFILHPLRITHVRFVVIEPIYKLRECFSIDLFWLIERESVRLFISFNSPPRWINGFEMDGGGEGASLQPVSKLPSNPFIPSLETCTTSTPLSFHFDASIIPRPMFYYLRGNRCTYNGIKVIFNRSIGGSIHYATWSVEGWSANENRFILTLYGWIF